MGLAFTLGEKMKFRKKPVVIDAIRFYPTHELTPGKTINDVHHSGISDCGDPMYVVKTLEGHMQIRPGEWLITGTAGEKYPCKHEIFLTIYEPLDALCFKPVGVQGVCLLNEGHESKCDPL